MKRFLKKSILFFTFFVLLCGVICGCKRPDNHDEGPRYSPSDQFLPQNLRLAVVPNQTPQKQLTDYLPLIHYLNRYMHPIIFSLDISKDYPSFEQKISNGDIEFLLSNPWQTLECMKKGYRVIAMEGAPENFKGYILVRKDSGIETILDLKGKTVSYPSPTSIAACVMQQDFLHRNGINVTVDIKNNYVVSLESALMNTWMNLSDAAATSFREWRAFRKDHPNEAKDLKVLCVTPPLVNVSFMVNRNVPDSVVKDILRILFSLHENPDGKDILNRIDTDRFYPAEDKNYDKVRDFIARFEKEVRPVRKK